MTGSATKLPHSAKCKCKLNSQRGLVERAVLYPCHFYFATYYSFCLQILVLILLQATRLHSDKTDHRQIYFILSIIEKERRTQRRHSLTNDDASHSQHSNSIRNKTQYANGFSSSCHLSSPLSLVSQTVRSGQSNMWILWCMHSVHILCAH